MAVAGGGAVVVALLATLLKELVVALALGQAFRGSVDLLPWIAWGYALLIPSFGARGAA
jgi:hypothetical protein